MKEYYQNKSHGYRLPYPIYKKMIKTIEAYEFYREIEKQGKSTEKSVMNPEKAAANVASAGMYVAAIEQALTSYVREEYRPAIFNHIVEGREYKELEQEYGISISTMKRWTQRFVYGVATELGENYFE